MRVFPCFTIGASLLLLPVVASGGGHDEFDKWLPLEGWAWDDARYDGLEGAAILYDGHVIDDSSLESKKGEHHQYRRIRVLDAAGVEEFGTIQLVYPEDYKIRSLAARTLKPDGTAIALEQVDFYDKTIIEYGKERVKAKAFAFKALAPGDILEYRYEISGPMDAPPLLLFGGEHHTFQADVTWLCKIVPANIRNTWEYQNYVWNAVYVILNGKEYLNAQEPYPHPASPEGHYFRFDGIPPVVSEPFMPSLGDVAVSFVGYYRFPNQDQKEDYWQRVAQALGEGIRSFVEDREGLSAWIGEVSTEERNLDRDLDRALAWMRSRWRCEEFLPVAERTEEISIQRSIKNALKAPVLRGYDLNRILVAMLQELGYDATLFFVRSADTGAFVEQWQSVDQFDFAGVAVRDGERIRWCFPAAPMGSAFALPCEAIGQTVLLADLTEDDETNPFPLLEWIEPPSSGQNLVELEVDLRPDADLKARGRLQATWRCENDVLRTSELLVSSREELLSDLRGRVLPDRVSWQAFDEEFGIDGWAFSYTCSLEVDGIIEDAGSLLLADLGDLRIDDFDLRTEEPRKLGFRFPFPVQYHTRVVLNAPAGYEVDTGVSPYRKTHSFADVSVQPAVSRTQHQLERRVDLKYSLFLSAAATVLTDLFAGADAAAAEPVVLRRVSSAERP